MAARKDYQAKKPQNEGKNEAQNEAVGEVLTVKGEPIPPHLAHLISYEMTDQGIAAESAKRKAKGVATPGLRVVSSEFDKKMQAFADDAHNGPEPWEQANPIEAAKARVPDAKGKAFHLFSERVYEHSGSRGFVPERDAEGQLIKVGNMVLASMPAERAARREQHYKDLAVGAQRAEAERFAEEQNQLASMGIAPLAAGESIGGNKNTAAYTGENESVPIGLTRVSSGEILAGV